MLKLLIRRCSRRWFGQFSGFSALYAGVNYNIYPTVSMHAFYYAFGYGDRVSSLIFLSVFGEREGVIQLNCSQGYLVDQVQLRAMNLLCFALEQHSFYL